MITVSMKPKQTKSVRKQKNVANGLTIIDIPKSCRNLFMKKDSGVSILLLFETFKYIIGVSNNVMD